MAQRIDITTQWKGLKVTATVVTGDWEGDPNVPRGIHYLPPYADDLLIETPDGDELSDYLTNDAVEIITDMVLTEAGEDASSEGEDWRERREKLLDNWGKG